MEEKTNNGSKLSVNFQNCYGIGEFEHEFDFEKSNSFLIYAPNGTMKSSLARTFNYFSDDGKERPCDRFYPERESVFDIKIGGKDIEKGQVLVVNPEDDEYDSSHKISNFIASKDLKKRYDSIYLELNDRQHSFIKILKRVSQSNDCEKEFIDSFEGQTPYSFIDLLENVEGELPGGFNRYKFRYNDIFDKKGNVRKFLDQHQNYIDQYIESYTDLLSNSEFFKGSDNSFGTYQANIILNSIGDNSFFEAGHSLELKGSVKITSAERLGEVVEEEIKKIVNNDELKSIFDKVDKAIGKNQELRVFKDAIEKDNLLLVELKDYEGFRRKVWLGYLTEMEAEVKELVEFYRSKKKDLESILVEAGKEIDEWKNLVDQFNARFYVPFKVILKNQEDVLLKQAKAILEFEFEDEREGEPVKRDGAALYKVLSKGEQKAYFILQLLFDVNSKSAIDQVPVVIFDDIADSFDYKNKYAIIEYIKDLHQSGDFKIILLTHNFDFYRTVASRLSLNRGHAVLMAYKQESGEIAISRGEYVKDVFRVLLTKVSDKKVFVSLIPFLRNLVDYTDEENCADYMTLTKCLHIKNHSDELVCQDVIDIWRNRYGGNHFDNIDYGAAGIIDTIYETADQITAENPVNEILLENKIALSIAIRLKAEQYMINQTEGIDLNNIPAPQTPHLFNSYKDTNPEEAMIRTIDKVILMTPENIHFNAFMFEPLVDISVHHLIGLYDEVKVLA
ncbi:MAG: hypothetical protein ABW116_01570 [Candidatus Sedimenticola sp. 20ELBAFRAG]